jgi:uncharacterized protein (TIGR03435 family)
MISASEFVASLGSQAGNHLWQSTLFAVVAALLTLALRTNRAQMRYWLWLAASIKFLIPFSLLVSVGSQFEWRNAPALAPRLAAVIEPIRQPPAPPAPTVAPPAARAASPVAPALLVAVWFAGCAVILAKWWARWWRMRAALRAASPLPIQSPLKVMSSSTLLEPGVFGIFRPVLLLPEGIANRLAPAQFRAILAHELCHVRRHDNLAAGVHMIVETAFWFHPLVWWIGARMIEERERACDEEVLRLGNEPQAYAEGVLNVCKFYLESPLACVSGVTGSDLKKRIEAIMTNRLSYRLTLARKLLLVTAGMAAVAGPVLVGILNAPRSRAQSKPEALTFEVASVKLSSDQQRQRGATGIPPVTRGNQDILTYTHVILKGVLARAYNVLPYEVVGPSWLDEKFYDIVAKVPQGAPAEQIPAMLQSLLAERFRMRVHWDAQQKAGYALVVGKTGSKLTRSDSGPNSAASPSQSFTMSDRGEIHLGFKGTTLEGFAKSLTVDLARPVVNKTGIEGLFDIAFDCSSDSLPGLQRMTASEDPPLGPSILTAIRGLGLDLVSQKVTAKRLVVDSAEMVPTEN